MRSIWLAAMLLVPLVLIGQDDKSPLLSSHDRVDGPLEGEYHVEDLQVFADGKVVYVEEDAKTREAKPERSTFQATIGPDDMRQLAGLLDSGEIRSLPRKISSKTQPVDFFWRKSLQINRPNKTQEIEIENFYPFLNAYQPAYANGLIELECSLQDIKLETAKRPRPGDEDDWCGAIRAKVAPVKAECHEDAVQPKIIAGEGWGLVRLGASVKAVDYLLGEGQAGHRYSDGYFKDYVAKGIQVSFENAKNTVHAIFFYDHQKGSEEFGVFCGQTDRGISWQSSAKEVRKAYGQPTADYSGGPGGAWERLVFAGIDFRFENGKLVRIGIPGN